MVYTDEEICYMIGHYKEKEQDICNRIDQLVSELSLADQNIYHLASFLHSGNSPGGGGGHQITDLSNVLVSKEKEKEEYVTALREGIAQLMTSLDDMRRIHLCYMILPYENHIILQKLYEQKIPWKLLIDQGQSRTSISRKRKKALNMIRSAYESSFTDTELMQLQKMHENGLKIKWDKQMNKGLLASGGCPKGE